MYSENNPEITCFCSNADSVNDFIFPDDTNLMSKYSNVSSKLLWYTYLPF